MHAVFFLHSHFHLVGEDTSINLKLSSFILVNFSWCFHLEMVIAVHLSHISLLSSVFSFVGVITLLPVFPVRAVWSLICWRCSRSPSMVPTLCINFLYVFSDPCCSIRINVLIKPHDIYSSTEKSYQVSDS